LPEIHVTAVGDEPVHRGVDRRDDDVSVQFAAWAHFGLLIEQLGG
jgi:hypothetical protein